MCRLFTALLLAAAALYAGARATLERAPAGVVVLRWATDPNPGRYLQCRLFSESHPGILVEPESAESDKLLVQCAVGVGADIIDMSQSFMQQLVEAGVLTDLSAAFRAEGLPMAGMYPAVRSSLEMDGSQYRAACSVSANVVIYNKAIFDDHGVPYPKAGWTTGDFIQTARKIASSPSRSGASHMPVAIWNSEPFVRDLMVSHGVRMFDDEGRNTLLQGRGMVDALRLYHDMMYRYGVLPRPEQSAAASSQGGWGFGGINLFSSGKAAMIFIGRWYTVQVGNYPALIGHLGTVETPRADGEPPASEIMCRAAGVNKLTPHPREALEFIKFLASAQYNRLIVEDGDAVPPNPSFVHSGRDLVNRQLPDPDAQQVFLDAIRDGRSLGRSPFVDAVVVDRWLKEQIEALENNATTPEQAAQTLSSEIDRAMVRDNQAAK